MKKMKDNIPTLIQQIRENMLNEKTPEHIRYNYMISMELIRDFADASLREYHSDKKKIFK
jgi:hypothetical protein